MDSSQKLTKKRGVKPQRFFSLARIAVSLLVVAEMHAAPSPAERVGEIQNALRGANLDGWLFYDFRGSDPLALRAF